MKSQISLEQNKIIVSKREKKRWREEKYLPYLLIIPSFLIIVTLIFYPVSRVFVMSLENYNLSRMFEKGFVGIDNFIRMADDELFISSLWISTKWVVSQVSLQLVCGLLIALLLNREFRGRGIVRALVFIPWAISGVMASILFLLIYNQHIGLLNYFLQDLGLSKEGVAWLAAPDKVFASTIVADLWRGIPFFCITLLAALQAIPKDIYESCEVDGSGRIRTFFSMTLPFLKQTIVFTTLLRAIWEFNNIDLIFNLTGGGPMDLTTTLSIYMMRTSILEGNYGYGSALAVVGFGVLLIFAVIYLALNKFGRSIYD